MLHKHTCIGCFTQVRWWWCSFDLKSRGKHQRKTGFQEYFFSFQEYFRLLSDYSRFLHNVFQLVIKPLVAHSFSWDSLEMRTGCVIEPVITLWPLEYCEDQLLSADLLQLVSSLRELASHKCLGKTFIQSRSLKTFFFARPYRYVGRILTTTIFLRCNRHEFQG